MLGFRHGKEVDRLAVLATQDESGDQELVGRIFVFCGRRRAEG